MPFASKTFRRDGERMKIKCAIFDFDGTLFDSMFIWDNVGEMYLRSLGKEPKASMREDVRTLSLYQSACYFKEEYGIDLSVEEIMTGINQTIEHFYIHEVQPKDGVVQFLRELDQQGISMCIATASDRYQIEAALKRCGMEELFEAVFTCTEVGHGKDEPEIFRKAMEYFGADRSNTVVFEDALHAIQTAKYDGFIVVSVFDSSEKRQDQIRDISDCYILDFEHLEEFWEFASGGKKMKTALSIAGSDCSGGAGIQADLKTMTMNGVYAMSVITALTAQNTMGVRAIQESTPEFLKQQLDAIFEDIYPDAVKIGMVASSELIQVIADRLKHHNAKNVVVDPVMVATSGSSLMENTAVKTLVEELLPISTLVTPNILEAEVLTGLAIETKEDMIAAAKKIGDEYHCSVLLKGGHSINDANDLLYADGEIVWFKGKRIDNPNTHGTGCTLSSAIASNLAKGFTLAESVKRAKDYISGALEAMLELGKGSGPMNHAFDLKSDFSERKL